jgi:hypothetical protein
LFTPVNRFHRIPKLTSTPRLHFDERDQAFPLHDEVDVAVPAPKPSLDDAPSLTSEPTLGDPLAKFPELLPGR